MSSSSSEPKMTLYEYICSKIPFFIDSTLQNILIRYSEELKIFYATKPNERNFSVFTPIMNELYRCIDGLTGAIQKSNTQKNSSSTPPNKNNEDFDYIQVYNQLTDNHKRVYLSKNHQYVIKKTDDEIPKLFIEVLIQIILEYYSNYVEEKNYVPNMVEFKKVLFQRRTKYHNSRNNKSYQFNMKMERLSGFTLYDYINGEVIGKTFDPVFLFTVLQKVYVILDFFYRRCGFVHGDLNPANVMIHEESNGDIKVQIIDFGYSLVNTNFLPNPNKFILSTFVDVPMKLLKIKTRSNGVNNYNNSTNELLSQMDMKHLMILVISELMKKDMTNKNGQKIFKHQVGTLLESHFSKFDSQRNQISRLEPSKKSVPNMKLVYNIVRLNSNPEFEINSFMTKMEELKGNYESLLKPLTKQSMGLRRGSLSNHGLSGLLSLPSMGYSSSPMGTPEKGRAPNPAWITSRIGGPSRLGFNSPIGLLPNSPVGVHPSPTGEGFKMRRRQFGENSPPKKHKTERTLFGNNN